MKNYISEKLVWLLVAITCLSISIPNAMAQGLKGEYPGKILGRRAYVSGVDDTERWKTLQKVQSKLLGMDRKQVESALGDPNIGKDTISYAITQEPISTHPSKWAHLTVFFTNGRVSKFSVQAE